MLRKALDEREAQLLGGVEEVHKLHEHLAQVVFTGVCEQQEDS